MPYYTSFQTLQEELRTYYLRSGERMQFQEAIASLQRKGKLLQTAPRPVFPDPLELRGPSLERYVDNLFFSVPPTHASEEHVEEEVMFSTQRDVFVFRHPRYTRPLLHSHDFWEIEFVMQGSCVFYFEEEVHTLSEGTAFLVAPGSRHDIEISDESSVYCIMLRRSTFETTFFSLLSRDDALSLFFRTNLKADSGPNYLMFHAKLLPEIEINLGCALAESYRTDVYANSCSVSRINLLFAALLRSAGEFPQFYRYQAGADFSQILHAIRHHYQTLTLTDLAEQFHYSKPYLCTLIKQNTGVSFTELLKQIRMSRAADYLLNTDLPVFEISEIVGYHSTDHFSRVFRSHYHCSPQEYRREHLENGGRFSPYSTL